MDPGTFACSQCDKSYSRKSHLLRHELTHTNQLSASCPICKKEFQKPEVARSHSKLCAKKHNQPIPPAARAGRKKLSCDECFVARTACDKVTPCCSRCHALGRQCSFRVNGSQRQVASDCSTVAVVKESNSSTAATTGGSGTDSYEFIGNEPFYFLLRFTDPSVKRDRLAIAETAGCSIRRNLATVYSSLESSLFPVNNSLQFFINDLVDPGLLTLNGTVTGDDYYHLDEFISDGVASAASELSNQLHKIATELVETSQSMIFNNDNSTGDDRQKNVLDIAELDPLFTASNLSVFISAFFHSLHWHMPVVHCPTFDPGKVSSCLLLAIFLAGAAYTVPFNSADLPPTLLTVAEEYIFRRIANLSTTTQDNYFPLRGSAIEAVQGALIVEMLQFSQGDPLARRRIRIIRHPCLVSTIRSLGLFHFKRRMAPMYCEESAWRELVEEEVCIRTSNLDRMPWNGSLSVEHLLILIYEQSLHLGYPKHAEELWWLLMTTLDVSNHSGGRNFQYLDATATDDLGKLNEFIQFASPWTGALDEG
ncbi:hypothetical protein UA08_02840 [Talaromyces atroroseus]|uniref:C2H2-type domain-containing protein n=1 Tax=Talaromyces atroroseus TaxID=1441469 RepID=A0A225AQV2_TALAT|nr:hypothetical protein UA08_02840 [Talaromyces atroroseus]OKL61883.1 hypothetical protein UA08_02840 [Talaromyces atroroseus]